MSKIDLVLQPLQGQDHVVFDHNQNKIAEDKEMGGVDHFSHRVCHLDLGIQPVRLLSCVLRAAMLTPGSSPALVPVRLLHIRSMADHGTLIKSLNLSLLMESAFSFAGIAAASTTPKTNALHRPT